MPRTKEHTQCDLCGEIFPGKSNQSKLRHKKKCTKRTEPIRMGRPREHKSDADRIKHWQKKAKEARAERRERKEKAK